MGRFAVLAAAVALPLVVATSREARAGGGSWQSLPLPVEAHISGLAMTQALQGRLWVTGAAGGVWRSDDHGDSWVFAGIGLPRDLSARSLVASAADGDAAWVAFDAAGIWGTTNAGATWSVAAGRPGGNRVNALLSHPTDAQRLVAGTSGGVSRGVWRSTDGAATWAPAMAGLFFPEVYALEGHPTDPSGILVGTRDGIARSTDWGDSWQWSYLGSEVYQVAHCRSAPDRAWARRYPAGLLQSTDGGGSWTNRATGSYQSVAVSPADPARLLASDLLFGCGWSGWGYTGSLELSTDAGATFSRVHTADCEDQAGLVATDVHDPDRAYALFTSGLFRSDAAGANGSWMRRIEGLRMVPLSAIRCGPDPDWYARGPAGVGTFVSTDAGTTWSVRDAPDCTGELRDFEVSATVPGLLFEAGVGSCKFPAYFFRRSTDGGATWWPEYDVPPGAIYDTFLVVANHGDGSTIYAWGAPSSPLLTRSTDGGSTFGFVGPTFRPVDAVIDAEDPHRVAAAAAEGPPVRLTTDGGVTWQATSAGLPHDDPPVRILMDAAVGDHLLVAFSTRGVYETRNGGETWQAVPFGAAGPGGAPGRSPSLAGEAVLPTVLDAAWDVAGEERRVFLATSAGPWIEGRGFVTEGVPSFRIPSIEYDGERGLLLLATAAMGAYSLEVAPLARPPSMSDGLATATHTAEAPRVVMSPNPFRSTTEIRYSTAGLAPDVSVDVYDSAGRHVRSLLPGAAGAEWGTCRWDGLDSGGSAAATGLYFVRIRSGDVVRTQRVVRLR